MATFDGLPGYVQSAFSGGGGNSPISIADSYGGNFDFSKSLGGGAKSGGSGMVIDGGSAVLGAASLGSSLISGIFGGIQQKRQIGAQFQLAAAQEKAARDAQFQNLLAGRDALYGGKLFDEQLQRQAANYQQAFLDPRASQLQSEDRQRILADTLSPQGQKARRQLNLDAMNKTLVEKRGALDAMFGPVRQDPFAYGNVPSYAA